MRTDNNELPRRKSPHSTYFDTSEMEARSDAGSCPHCSKRSSLRTYRGRRRRLDEKHEILIMKLRVIFLLKFSLTFACTNAQSAALPRWETNAKSFELKHLQSSTSSNDIDDNAALQNSTSKTDYKAKEISLNEDFSNVNDQLSSQGANFNGQDKQDNQILSKTDKSYRISMLEPKPAATIEEPVFRRISNSSSNGNVKILVPGILSAQLVRSEYDNQNEETEETETTTHETTDTPATSAPIIPSIMVYSISASIIMLIILLLIVTIMVMAIVCTAPTAREEFENEYNSYTGRKKNSKSDNFSDEGSSEQTIELMERRTSCSSRKGSCKIYPNTNPRSKNSKKYFVSCVCNLPGDELSPTSSAGTSANATFKRN